MADVNALLSQMQLDAKGLSSNNEEAREKIIQNAYALIGELETTTEFIERTRWAEPIRNGASLIAINTGLFKLLSGRTDGVTVTEMAKDKNMDPDFVLRLMRHLAAMGIVREVSAGTFASTKKSEALTTPAWIGASQFLHHMQGVMAQHMPIWAEEIGYKNPVHGDAKGPFQRTFKTELTPYAWLTQTRPDLGRYFNDFMTGKSDTTRSWMDPGFYAVRENLKIDESSSAPLIVDIGGGLGQDMKAFCKKYPDVPGRLVVEDKDDVLGQISKEGLNERIEIVTQDFFQPQKISGARAYYLHNILHNWDEGSCEKILSQIKPAMKPGYSKIMIFDMVIPATGAHWRATSLDWVMCAFQGLQRSEAQWKALFGKVGMKIEKIWNVDSKEESLIEVVLA